MRSFPCLIQSLGLHCTDPLLMPFPSFDTLASRLAHTSAAIFPPEPGPGTAAVALLVRTTDLPWPEVLLIRRADHVDDPWSGHMALPGGRWEPDDRTLRDTAIRETLEEVQVDLNHSARPLGHLRTLPAFARGRTTGLTVTPFVFALQGAPQLIGNHEVQELVWVPVSRLLAPESRTTVVSAERPGAPAWDIEGRVIWGLTHRMLSDFLETLA